MKQFMLMPKISVCSSCAEFAETFSIGETDLVLASRSAWKAGFADKQAGTVLFIGDYGRGEPTDEMVEAIAADIRKPYERVIAIGGGSVLDIAKLFALKRTLPVTDLFDKVFPAEKVRKLVLVPTTCGTGSEVTNISILEFKKRHTKFGLAVDALYADDAVLIPELLRGLPFHVFATSSIDALVHATESYLSPKATAFSQTFSVEAMTRILTGFRTIRDCGKEILPELLSDFSMASTMAGIAFGNAGTGAVHAMSYPVGAEFHVPHGEANYAMYTGVFKKYMQKQPDGAIADLNRIMAAAIGCSPDAVYEELEVLLNESILQKKALHEYGMTQAQIPEFTDSVIANQQRLLANNYVFLNRDELIEIYTALY